ncbi:trypsin CFT-1-like [Anticarsia gemmatalis]|uniref:trypsin CFT-1-like n=1 Tax=Anticarsia gemmatalis TaxID=129554 RepID=UPI003F76F098
MRALVLFAVCIAAVAAVPANPQRIVGGSVTTIEQYPEMASVIYTWDWNTYWQRCGGAIINSRSVLSAAHCFVGDPANRWRFRVGSTWANSGGVVHILANLILHPSYNRWTNDNDIAILRSTTTIVHGTSARPASIAGANYNLGDNQVVWAAGWGALYADGPSSEQLRHVQIWTINQAVCADRYRQARPLPVTITANMLCSGWLNVGGRDQCQGDSGGPLYHNRIVVGVCSFGIGCADSFFPGVNARVSRFTSWIQSNA